MDVCARSRGCGRLRGAAEVMGALKGESACLPLALAGMVLAGAGCARPPSPPVVAVERDGSMDDGERKVLARAEGWEALGREPVALTKVVRNEAELLAAAQYDKASGEA